MDLLDDHAGAVASRRDVMAWITEVVDHGIRRPGTTAGRRVEEWALARFRHLGLEDVRAEPVDVATWTHGEARLVAWPADRPGVAVELTGFPLPHTRGTPGLEADVVTLGAGDAVTADGAPAAGSPAGAIVVDVLRQGRLPQSLVAELATGGYDPDRELDGADQLLPFGPRLGREVDAAVEAGAAAYVGVLADMGWPTRDYYVPYDAEPRPLAGLWLDRDDGRQLTDMLAQGRVRGRIEVDGQVGVGTSANLVGTLAGASDEWVVVGSHHDAPWASAVEDGTGIGLVLAQARFWAQVPPERRPHNMLFLLNAGHMAGGAGIYTFLDQHAALLDEVVLAVHLEHAAAASRVEGDALVATDEPEIGWWFTSQDPSLERVVLRALEVEGLRRTWVLPPEAFGAFPPTDGGPFHTRGVPLVDFLSAPVFLFDRCDTLDKVHEPSLEPITRATIRIIDALAGRTAADLRSRRV